MDYGSQKMKAIRPHYEKKTTGKKAPEKTLKFQLVKAGDGKFAAERVKAKKKKTKENAYKLNPPSFAKRAVAKRAARGALSRMTGDQHALAVY